MGFDKSLLNVILLGLAFMLVFTAFQTMGNIEKTILNSIHDENKNFYVDAYISLGIIYGVFSIFQWAVPSVISVIGAKLAMLLGALTYLVFIASFLVPKTWLVYLVSAVIGIGAAMIWTGQGNYLAMNSSMETISRNSGIFWALLQLSMFTGNTFVYFQFQGKDSIDKDSRTIVIYVLTSVAIAGVVLFVFLPKPRRPSEVEGTPIENLTPLQALKGAGKLFLTKNMLMLSLTFIYTGLELGFYSSVYSSSLGFTKAFESRKELVGLSGIFIGVGEVIGGAAFGILGSKTNKLGRDPIVIFGFIVHVIAFFIIFLNLPNNSPFGDTDQKAFISSNVFLAILCSFLLGFADACFNTQIFSILGGEYSKDSTAAFAIFKFTQSVASAISFVYATQLVLYAQLGILLIFAIAGTITFVLVEWSFKNDKRNGLNSSEPSLVE